MGMSCQNSRPNADGSSSFSVATTPVVTSASPPTSSSPPRTTSLAAGSLSSEGMRPSSPPSPPASAASKGEGKEGDDAPPHERMLVLIDGENAHGTLKLYSATTIIRVLKERVLSKLAKAYTIELIFNSDYPGYNHLKLLNESLGVTSIRPLVEHFKTGATDRMLEMRLATHCFRTNDFAAVTLIAGDRDYLPWVCRIEQENRSRRFYLIHNLQASANLVQNPVWTKTWLIDDLFAGAPMHPSAQLFISSASQGGHGAGTQRMEVDEGAGVTAKPRSPPLGMPASAGAGSSIFGPVLPASSAAATAYEPGAERGNGASANTWGRSCIYHRRGICRFGENCRDRHSPADNNRPLVTSGAGAGDLVCFACNQQGHTSKNCPRNTVAGGHRPYGPHGPVVFASPPSANGGFPTGRGMPPQTPSFTQPFATQQQHPQLQALQQFQTQLAQPATSYPPRTQGTSLTSPAPFQSQSGPPFSAQARMPAPGQLLAQGFVRPQGPTGRVWVCELCGLDTFNSETQYREHLEGKRHRARCGDLGSSFPPVE